MKTLHHYRIEIVTSPGMINKEVGNKYHWGQVKILGENKRRLVLDNESFTTIEKKKSKYLTSLNSPAIGHNVDDTIWGSCLTYTLYSDKKKRKSTIKKEIAEYISKKFGAFSDVDLSFMDT